MHHRGLQLSPQLAKQMAIAADIGAYSRSVLFFVWRTRIPTESTGLDLEMAIETHYISRSRPKRVKYEM